MWKHFASLYFVKTVSSGPHNRASAFSLEGLTFDSLCAASVLMSGNDDDDFAGDRSGGTSSLSGQPRSVRPKSVLAIESDSD